MIFLVTPEASFSYASIVSIRKSGFRDPDPGPKVSPSSPGKLD